VTGNNPGARQMFPGMPPAWMLFSTNLLFFGLESPSHIIPVGDGGGSGRAGVWLMPVAQVETARAVQKQIQLARMAQENAQAVAAEEQHRKDLEQRHKDLLAKYDRNHNGIIDSEEKEEALDDPLFIESELDTMDANHNGRLDAEELVWFDANQNKVLDPKEQAGIDIAQHLLAAKLLKQFDANGDGLLDRSEFDNLRPSGPEAGTPFIHSIPFPDENHDGQVDLGELESFLKQQTHRGLRSRGGPTAALFNQSRGDTNQLFDPRQLFKTEVEFYWQNPGGITHGPPFNRRTPPGWIGVTNSMPNGKTP
jgi:Ca2+-binding EF-hand superfamily protein